MSAFFLQHPKETDLALFAGGESGPFARWRIERHVERCAHCQELTADYFRLPDQLNALADMPEIDWNQLATRIETGVRQDAAGQRTAGRKSFPPLAWQAGLVAATVLAAVVVVRQGDEPQISQELTAEAPRQTAMETAPMAESAATPAASAAVEEDRQTAVMKRAAVAETSQAKANAERREFVSDVAAPAPPPAPAAAGNAARQRAVEVISEPVVIAADSAEMRLRSDAAARVGAVSAITTAVPAGFTESQQAVGYAANAANWVEYPVEALSFEDAPVQLSTGRALVARQTARTPHIAVENRSGKAIARFELVWIVGDEGNQKAARITGQQAPADAVLLTGETPSLMWLLPEGVSRVMRVYPASVGFEDGTTWMPSQAQLAEQGLDKVLEDAAELPRLIP